MPKNLSATVQDRDEKGTSSKFSEPPDIILPSQYFGVVERRGYLTPEKKLMLAVLESVVHDFQRYRLASRRRGEATVSRGPDVARLSGGNRNILLCRHLLEFAKLRGARAFSGWFTALPVTTMIKFLEKMKDHCE